MQLICINGLEMRGSIITSLVLGSSLFLGIACSGDGDGHDTHDTHDTDHDHDHDHETEVISKVTLTFTPASGGDPVVASFSKGKQRRRLHKAFLRYHDPDNWPMLREALRQMGREDLIGNGKRHLIPTYQPRGTGQGGGEGRRKKTKGRNGPRKGDALTQHTGLPPRQTHARTRRKRPGRTEPRG